MTPTAAVVLTGGGARAAYQVGFLRCLSRHLPRGRFPIITGVSAGAINAAFLAAHGGDTTEAAEELTRLWVNLTPERVFRAGGPSLARGVLRWGVRLLSGGSRAAPTVRGLLDTAPLRSLLEEALGARRGEIPGIDANIAQGRLLALALTTLRYSTGQTVTWVQGREIGGWERSHRVGRAASIRVEHVMASAALPLIFPAVRLEQDWYGDGGVRMSAPLAPAIHLGADRILAISTRYPRSRIEADRPAVTGYPPPAQVVGTLLNAIFLDAVDQDAYRLERINRLLAKIPPEEHGLLRPIRLLVLRPSQDLGRLAAEFEAKLPRGFRFLTRGLGTRQTSSPDLLSLLLFQPDYLERLIAVGEADAEARAGEIMELLGA